MIKSAPPYAARAINKSFEKYPPRQKAASFSIDQVMEKMKENVGPQ